MNAILMTEEFWRNSQLSVAKYFGGCRYNGHEYIIVDKFGRDLFECSRIAAKEGREKAIEPGEPADLIRKDFKGLYKKNGPREVYRSTQGASRNRFAEENEGGTEMKEEQGGRAMKEAVNFLTQVFYDSVEDVAAIKVAEADGDKATIEKYLLTVHNYTARLINRLNEEEQ